MPALTRRGCPDAREECWHVYYGDEHAGTIAIRTGIPHDEDPGGWRCGFHPGSRPGECQHGTAATFDQAAPISRPRGECFCRTAPRPIFRHGAIKRLGRLRCIAALIGMSACRRIGSRHGPPVADRGWKRPFDDPIPLPRSRQLVTLEDAGNYITKLPKAEHEAAEWQTAMEALILVGTLGRRPVCARVRGLGAAK